MAMVRGDDNERVFRVSFFQRNLHGVGQLNGFRQGTVGTAGVMAMIDPTRLHGQKEALVVVIENANGLARHFTQGRFSAQVLAAIGFVTHMGFIKQGKHTFSRFRIQGVKSALIDNVVTCRIGSLPFSRQISPICSIALYSTYRIAGIFGWIIRQEMAAATAHDHLNTVDVSTGVAPFEERFKFHQLIGDIETACQNRCIGHVRNIFPIAIR